MPNSFAPLGATEGGVDFRQLTTSRGHRRWSRGSEVNVKGVLSNNALNPPRFAASRRLQGAQAARLGSRAG